MNLSSFTSRINCFYLVKIDDLTRAMFDDADSENRGAITYEALTNQLTKHGGLLENLSIRLKFMKLYQFWNWMNFTLFYSIDRWLVPCPHEMGKKPSDHSMKRLPHQLSTPYIKNNHIYLIFVSIFTFINVFLFITRAIQYRKSNFFVIMARACGELLLSFYRAFLPF